MIRLSYVAGRFRHYLPNGELDLERMVMEVEDERKWAQIILECGMMPICPLANSFDLMNVIPQDEWITRDLAVLRRYRKDYDTITMRPGWDVDPESKGARAEYECAVDRKLIVAHGMHGEDAVRAFLDELNGKGE